MSTQGRENITREWNGEDVACSILVTHLTTLIGCSSIIMTWINLYFTFQYYIIYKW